MVVSLSFLLPYLGFAFQPATYPDIAAAKLGYARITANGSAIQISPEWGRVTSSYQGRSGKTVVYIQDLHCNYEVQSHIRSMLQNLISQNQLRLVGVEGESQPVDVSLLSTVPVPKIKEQIGEYFMQRGRVTGPEYQAAVGQQPLDLVGIENQGLYDADRALIADFLTDESQGYVEDLRQVLEKLKKPLYNSDLAKMDHEKETFAQEGMTLEKYCDYLLSLVKAKNLSLAQFPVMKIYSLEHRLPVTAEVDYEKLYSEAEDLERVIRGTYYTSPDQKQLDHALFILKIMESMLNISAVEKDLMYYRRHKDEFAIQSILHFLEDVCYRYALDPDLGQGVLKLDEGLAKAAKFYDIADQRSEAFIRNLQNHMEGRKQKLAVLITGGFHATGVESALRREDVSYLTIRPRISRTDEANPYFSLLRNEPSPLEKFLDRTINICALQSYLAKKDRLQKWMSAIYEIRANQEVANEPNLSLAERALKIQALRTQYANEDASVKMDYKPELSDPAKNIFVYQFQGAKPGVVMPYVVVRNNVANENLGYTSLIPDEKLDSALMFQMVDGQNLNKLAQAMGSKIRVVDGSEKTKSLLAQLEKLSGFWTNQRAANDNALTGPGGSMEAAPDMAMAGFHGSATVEAMARALDFAFRSRPATGVNRTGMGVLDAGVNGALVLVENLFKNFNFNARIFSGKTFFEVFGHQASAPTAAVPVIREKLQAMKGLAGATSQARTQIQEALLKIDQLASGGQLTVSINDQPQPIKNLQIVTVTELEKADPKMAAQLKEVGAFFQVQGTTGIIYVLPGADPAIAAVHEFMERIQGLTHGQVETLQNQMVRALAARNQGDLLKKAVAWAESQLGYGLTDQDTRVKGSVLLNTEFENVLVLAERQPALQAFIQNNPQRLAIAGMAYHNAKSPLWTDASSLLPSDQAVALATDFNRAEQLAREVTRKTIWQWFLSLFVAVKAPLNKLPKTLTEGNTPLAQLVRTIQHGGKTFTLGLNDVGAPERLISEAYSDLQLKAIGQLARAYGVEVMVAGPEFNPYLTFNATPEQKTAAYQRLITLARRINAAGVVMRTGLDAEQQQILASFAAQKGQKSVKLLDEDELKAAAAALDQPEPGEVPEKTPALTDLQISPQAIQDLQSTFDQLGAIPMMPSGQTFSLPANGATVSGTKEAFLRARTTEEIRASKLSSGCGDYGILFYQEMKAKGYEVNIVDSAEISIRGLESNFAGHVVAEVFDKVNQRWLLVDPTDRVVISDNWDTKATSYQQLHNGKPGGAHFWIGFRGALEDLRGQITGAEGLSKFYENTLADLLANHRDFAKTAMADSGELTLIKVAFDETMADDLQQGLRDEESKHNQKVMAVAKELNVQEMAQVQTTVKIGDTQGHGNFYLDPASGIVFLQGPEAVHGGLMRDIIRIATRKSTQKAEAMAAAAKPSVPVAADLVSGIRELPQPVMPELVPEEAKKDWRDRIPQPLMQIVEGFKTELDTLGKTPDPMALRAKVKELEKKLRSHSEGLTDKDIFIWEAVDLINLNYLTPLGFDITGAPSRKATDCYLILLQYTSDPVVEFTTDEGVVKNHVVEVVANDDKSEVVFNAYASQHLDRAFLLKANIKKEIENIQKHQAYSEELLKSHPDWARVIKLEARVFGKNLTQTDELTNTYMKEFASHESEHIRQSRQYQRVLNTAPDDRNLLDELGAEMQSLLDSDPRRLLLRWLSMTLQKTEPDQTSQLSTFYDAKKNKYIPYKDSNDTLAVASNFWYLLGKITGLDPDKQQRQIADAVEALLDKPAEVRQRVQKLKKQNDQRYLSWLEARGKVSALAAKAASFQKFATAANLDPQLKKQVEDDLEQSKNALHYTRFTEETAAEIMDKLARAESIMSSPALARASLEQQEGAAVANVSADAISKDDPALMALLKKATPLDPAASQAQAIQNALKPLGFNFDQVGRVSLDQASLKTRMEALTAQLSTANPRETAQEKTARTNALRMLTPLLDRMKQSGETTAQIVFSDAMPAGEMALAASGGDQICLNSREIGRLLGPGKEKQLARLLGHELWHILSPKTKNQYSGASQAEAAIIEEIQAGIMSRLAAGYQMGAADIINEAAKMGQKQIYTGAVKAQAGATGDRIVSAIARTSNVWGRLLGKRTLAAILTAATMSACSLNNYDYEQPVYVPHTYAEMQVIYPQMVENAMGGYDQAFVNYTSAEAVFSKDEFHQMMLDGFQAAGQKDPRVISFYYPALNEVRFKTDPNEHVGARCEIINGKAVMLFNVESFNPKSLDSGLAASFIHLNGHTPTKEELRSFIVMEMSSIESHETVHGYQFEKGVISTSLPSLDQVLSGAAEASRKSEYSYSQVEQHARMEAEAYQVSAFYSGLDFDSFIQGHLADRNQAGAAYNGVLATMWVDATWDAIRGDVYNGLKDLEIALKAQQVATVEYQALRKGSDGNYILDYLRDGQAGEAEVAFGVPAANVPAGSILAVPSVSTGNDIVIIKEVSGTPLVPTSHGKIIRGTNRTQPKGESYDSVLKRGTDLERLNKFSPDQVRRYQKLLQDRLPEIMDHLTPLLNPAILSNVQTKLTAIANGAVRTKLQSIDAIQNDIAVSQYAGGALGVIMENHLFTNDLADSMFIHEAIEAVLDYEGVAKAHAISHVVELDLFPESIKLKLEDIDRYDNAQLRNLRDDAQTERDAIRDQPGDNPEAKARKERQTAHVDLVAKAADAELARRSKIDVPVINYQDFKLGNQINEGTHSNVYLADYQGKKCVYIRHKIFDPNRDTSLDLSATSFGDIRDIRDRATMVVSNYEKMKGITYQGHSLAPGVYAAVKDADGEVDGYLAEFVEGQTLHAALQDAAVNEQDLDDIEKQLADQLHLLHDKAHLRHGDVHPQNVMISRSPGGKLVARFIDFSITSKNFTKEEDLRKLHLDFNSIRIFYLKVLNERLPEIRKSKDTADKAEFFGAQKQNIVILKNAFHRVLNLHPDNKRGMQQIGKLWEPFYDLESDWLWTMDNFAATNQRLKKDAQEVELIRQAMVLDEKVPKVVREAAAAFLDRYTQISQQWQDFFSHQDFETAVKPHNYQRALPQDVQDTMTTQPSADVEAEIEVARTKETESLGNLEKHEGGGTKATVPASQLQDILAENGITTQKAVAAVTGHYPTLEALRARVAEIEKVIGEMESRRGISGYRMPESSRRDILKTYLRNGKPISADTVVARPMIDARVGVRRAETWKTVQNVMSPTAAQRVIDNLKMVEMEEVGDALEGVMDRFNSAIGGRKYGVLLLRGNNSEAEEKSNAWMHNLAKEKGLMGDNAAVMKATWDTFKVTQGAMEGLQDYMIIDDASYSGLQIAILIGKLLGQENLPAEITVHVAVPFLTAPAIQWIESQVRRMNETGTTKVNLKLYYDEKLSKTVSYGEAVQDSAVSKDEADKPLVYFAHKRADGVSLPKVLLRPKNPNAREDDPDSLIPELVSPYKMDHLALERAALQKAHAQQESPVQQAGRSMIEEFEAVTGLASVLTPDQTGRVTNTLSAEFDAITGTTPLLEPPMVKMGSSLIAEFEALTGNKSIAEPPMVSPETARKLNEEFEATTGKKPVAELGEGTAEEGSAEATDKGKTPSGATQGAAKAKVNLDRIRNSSRSLEAGLQKTIGAALELAGLKTGADGEVVFQPKTMLARLDTGIKALTDERDALMKKAVKSADDRKALANAGRAIAELKAIQDLMAKAGNAQSYPVKISDGMAINNPAIMIDGTIYINGNYTRQMQAWKPLQLARFVMHEVGHAAGISGDQAGEARAGMLARIATGSRIGIAEVMGEIRKVERRLVFENALGVKAAAQGGATKLTDAQIQAMKQWIADKVFGVFDVDGAEMSADELRKMLPGHGKDDETREVGVRILGQITAGLAQAEGGIYSQFDLIEAFQQVLNGKSPSEAVENIVQEREDVYKEAVAADYATFEKSKGTIDSVDKLRQFVKAGFQGEDLAYTPAMLLYAQKMVERVQASLADTQKATEFYSNFEQRAGELTEGLPAVLKTSVAGQLRTAVDQAVGNKGEVQGDLIAKRLEGKLKTLDDVRAALRNFDGFLKANFSEDAFQGQAETIQAEVRKIGQEQFKAAAEPGELKVSTFSAAPLQPVLEGMLASDMKPDFIATKLATDARFKALFTRYNSQIIRVLAGVTKSQGYAKALAELGKAKAACETDANRAQIRQALQASLREAALLFDQMDWADAYQYAFQQYIRQYITTVLVPQHRGMYQQFANQATLAQDATLAVNLNVLMEELDKLKAGQTGQAADLTAFRPTLAAQGAKKQNTASEARVVPFLSRLLRQTVGGIQRLLVNPFHGPALQDFLGQYPETKGFLQAELKLSTEERAELDRLISKFEQEPRKATVLEVVQLLNKAHSGRTVAEFIRIMTQFATQAALKTAREGLTGSYEAALKTPDGKDRFALFSTGSMTRQGESTLKSDVDLVWITDNVLGEGLAPLKISVAATLKSWGFDADPTALQYEQSQLATWRNNTEIIRQSGFLGTRYISGNTELQSAMDNLCQDILTDPRFIFDNASVAAQYLILVDPRDTVKRNLNNIRDLITNVSTLAGRPLYSLEQAVSVLRSRQLLNPEDAQALLDAYEVFVQNRMNGSLDVPTNEAAFKQAAESTHQILKRIYRPLQAQHYVSLSRTMYRQVFLSKSGQVSAEIASKLEPGSALPGLWKEMQQTPVPTQQTMQQWTARVQALSVHDRYVLFTFISRNPIRATEDELIVAMSQPVSAADAAVRGKMERAFRLAGFQINSADSTVTLATGALRAKVTTALQRLDAEKAALERKTMKRDADKASLAKFDQARAELQRLENSLPQDGQVTFRVMVSAGMSNLRLGGAMVSGDAIYLNAWQLENFSDRNLLTVMKAVMHETGHIAGLTDDQTGETSAYILGRLAAGYQMGIMDVIKEVAKVDSGEKRLTGEEGTAGGRLAAQGGTAQNQATAHRGRSPEEERIFQYAMATPAERARLPLSKEAVEFNRSRAVVAKINESTSMGSDAETYVQGQSLDESLKIMDVIRDELVKVSGQQFSIQRDVSEDGLVHYFATETGLKLFIDAPEAESLQELRAKGVDKMPGNIEVASEVLNIKSAPADADRFFQSLYRYQYAAGNMGKTIAPHFHIGTKESIAEADYKKWRMAWGEVEGYVLPMVAQILGSTSPALPIKGEYANNLNLQPTELGGDMGAFMDYANLGYGDGEEMKYKYFNFLVKDGLPEFRMRFPVTNPTEFNQLFVLFSAVYWYMNNRVANSNDSQKGFGNVMTEALPFAGYFAKGLNADSVETNLGKFVQVLNLIVSKQTGDKTPFFDEQAVRKHFRNPANPKDSDTFWGTIQNTREKCQQPGFAEQHGLDVKVVNCPVDATAMQTAFGEIAEMLGYSFKTKIAMGAVGAASAGTIDDATRRLIVDTAQNLSPKANDPVRQKLTASLRLAGLNLDAEGKVTFKTEMLRGRAQAALDRIRGEQAKFETTGTRRQDYAETMDKYSKAQKELQRILETLPANDSQQTFTIKLSDKMGNRFHATTLLAERDTVILNVNQLEKFNPSDRFKLLKMIFHEMGHVAGIQDDLQSEVSASILGRLASGYQMDVNDVVKEIDKVGSEKLILGETVSALPMAAQGAKADAGKNRLLQAVKDPLNEAIRQVSAGQFNAGQVRTLVDQASLAMAKLEAKFGKDSDVQALKTAFTQQHALLEAKLPLLSQEEIIALKKQVPGVTIDTRTESAEKGVLEGKGSIIFLKAIPRDAIQSIMTHNQVSRVEAFARYIVIINKHEFFHKQTARSESYLTAQALQNQYQGLAKSNDPEIKAVLGIIEDTARTYGYFPNEPDFFEEVLANYIESVLAMKEGYDGNYAREKAFVFAVEVLLKRMFDSAKGDPSRGIPANSQLRSYIGKVRTAAGLAPLQSFTFEPVQARAAVLDGAQKYIGDFVQLLQEKSAQGRVKAQAMMDAFEKAPAGQAIDRHIAALKASAPAAAHTLPLYLWRPFKARLDQALAQGEIDQDLYGRLVNAQGVMRVENNQIVAESPLVIQMLAGVLSRETSRPLSEQDVRDYLQFHENTHLAVAGLQAGTLDQIVTALKNPALYQGTGLGGYEQLKQWFANNYGGSFSEAGNDLAFAEELLVVFHTEQQMLNGQTVRLVADKGDAKTRMDLPSSVASVLARVADQLPKAGEVRVAGQQGNQGRITTRMPAEVRPGFIEKAIAWGQTNYGYGAADTEGSVLTENTALAEAFDAVMTLADSDEALAAFIGNNPERLALAGMAYYNEARLKMGNPAERASALARDFWEAEKLANAILKPGFLDSLSTVAWGQEQVPDLSQIPESLKQGNSALADLVRSLEATTLADQRVYSLGRAEILNPERQMPAFFSEAQREAIRRLAASHHVALSVWGLSFNPFLGFRPQAGQVEKAYAEWADFAQAMGAEHIAVPLAGSTHENLIPAIEAAAAARGLQVSTERYRPGSVSLNVMAIVRTVLATAVNRVLVAGWNAMVSLIVKNGRMTAQQLAPKTGPAYAAVASPAVSVKAGEVNTTGVAGQTQQPTIAEIMGRESALGTAQTQEKAGLLQQALENVKETPLGRVLGKTLGLPAGLKLMLILGGFKLQGAAATVAVGVLTAAWAGVSLMLGGSLGWGLAANSLALVLAVFVPARYAGYCLNSALVSKVTREVSAATMGGKLEQVLQANRLDANSQAFLTVGLLESLQALSENSQYTDEILNSLAALSQLPGVKYESLAIEISGRQVNVNLPMTVYKNNTLLRRLRNLPMMDKQREHLRPSVPILKNILSAA
jgi:sugar phosphate isomerase/epimerase/predicted Zn-dependent protease/serine/threonine-protein kinase RIO1